MVNYLKGVSNMLAIVLVVLTGNILQHLQTEKRMLNLVFHLKILTYAWYNSFQNVFMRNISRSNLQTFNDLLQYRYGASSIGDPVRTIHGDLVKEHFNKECKGTAGLFQSGYIFHYTSVNKRIVISHVCSKLR